MNKLLLLCFLTSGFSNSFSQNLILNPSFENYNTLPCSWITSATEFNADMQNWTQPSDGSTDIFSTLVATTCYANCFSTNTSSPGPQAPRTGSIMCAIVTFGSGCGFQPNYREYLQAQLSQPLIAGHSYYAELYVSLGDNCDNGTNNIGMYFTPTQVFNPTCFVLNFSPQIIDTTIITDTAGWVKVSGTFIAAGNEQYMLIGNFLNNASTQTGYVGGGQLNTRFYVDDASVVEVSAPTINLASSDTSFCEKQCIDFFDLSTNNPTSWQWFFPGADSTSSTVQNPTGICYNSYGSFDVTLIACNATNCDTIILTDFINEYQTPIVTVYQSGDTLFVSSAITYQWYELASGIIPGATDSFYVFNQSGNYYCIIEDSIGCIASSNIISNTALNQLDISNAVIISPNPSDGIFTIQFGGFNFDQLQIFDFLGNLIFEEILDEHQIKNIDLRNFENGVYLLRLSSKSISVNKKFILEK